MEELQRTVFGKIRSITPGELTIGASYTISVTGRPLPNGITITEIVRDENAFFIFNTIEYHVYAKSKENEEPFLWKIISGHKMSVEFFVPGKESTKH